jgi:hypothetical protein
MPSAGVARPTFKIPAVAEKAQPPIGSELV